MARDERRARTYGLLRGTMPENPAAADEFDDLLRKTFPGYIRSLIVEERQASVIYEGQMSTAQLNRLDMMVQGFLRRQSPGCTPKTKPVASTLARNATLRDLVERGKKAAKRDK